MRSAVPVAVLLFVAVVTVSAQAQPANPTPESRAFCRGPDPVWSYGNGCGRHHRKVMERRAERQAARAAVAAPVEPAAPPAPPVSTVAPTTGGTSWDATAACESSGDWSANTGNGYYGGLQFDSATWDAYGDPSCPEASDCSQGAQIAAAEAMPYDGWPNC